MLYLLDPERPDTPFPPVSQAEKDPDGLLAIGGDLSPERLLNAYRRGIFPWFSETQPILWWCPNPRMVLFPERFRISRSLGKTLRNRHYSVTFDQAFSQVIEACAAPREGQDDTWITSDMMTAYIHLHRLHFGHSVEVWQDGELVGGLYGLALGQVFFGESMFSRMRDASKIALAYLTRNLNAWGYRMIDCQIHSRHLITLGAEEITRKRFCGHLDQWCIHEGLTGCWRDQPILKPLS